MPSFDDFSIWDDVVHPFFLSIATYLVSFGPLLILVFIVLFSLSGSTDRQLNSYQSSVVHSVAPELPNAAAAAKQSEEVKALLKENVADQKARVEAIDTGEIPDDSKRADLVRRADELNQKTINDLMQASRKAQLESVVGRAPESAANERSAMFAKASKFGIAFFLIAGILLIWGFIYFPAACAVAGYTRSFTATLNPTVGVDTIRRLGFDYLKILLMVLLLVIISGVIGLGLSAVFSPFDLPAIGNIPAKIVGSLFNFYFAIVFACIIGFAMYKASDRLKLFR